MHYIPTCVTIIFPIYRLAFPEMYLVQSQAKRIFSQKNYLLFRFNELLDALIHNTFSDIFTDFRFPFFD